MADGTEDRAHFESLLIELKRMLGLAATASDVDVIASVRALTTTAPQSASPDPSKFVSISDFEKVVTDLNRLNQGVALQAAQGHVELQIRNGNLFPFLREWGVALCSVNKPAFDAFVEKTRGGVQRLLAPSGLGAPPPPATAGSKLTPDEIALCARMGITGEELMASRAFLEAQNNQKG